MHQCVRHVFVEKCSNNKLRQPENRAAGCRPAGIGLIEVNQQEEVVWRLSGSHERKGLNYADF